VNLINFQPSYIHVIIIEMKVHSAKNTQQLHIIVQHTEHFNC